MSLFGRYPVISGLVAGGAAMYGLYSVGKLIAEELPGIRDEFDDISAREKEHRRRLLGQRDLIDVAAKRTCRVLADVIAAEAQHSAQQSQEVLLAELKLALQGAVQIAKGQN